MNALLVGNLSDLESLETGEVLSMMLKESTGKHFLDSGGAYGRHWQRNQDRDFESENETAVSFDIYTDHKGDRRGEVDYRINLYHFLKNQLEYEPTVDRLYHKFYSCGRYAKESHGSLIANFIELLASIEQQESDSLLELLEVCIETIAHRLEEEGEEAGSNYLDGDYQQMINDAFLNMILDGWSFHNLSIATTVKYIRITLKLSGYAKSDIMLELATELATLIERVIYLDIEGEHKERSYTYNDPNLLSQDFIYDGYSNGLLAIQIHNGCDARGGFTDPRFFNHSENYGFYIWDYNRMTLRCKQCNAYWDFDRGYQNDNSYGEFPQNEELARHIFDNSCLCPYCHEGWVSADNDPIIPEDIDSLLNANLDMYDGDIIDYLQAVKAKGEGEVPEVDFVECPICNDPISHQNQGCNGRCVDCFINNDGNVPLLDVFAD